VLFDFIKLENRTGLFTKQTFLSQKNNLTGIESIDNVFFPVALKIQLGKYFMPTLSIFLFCVLKFPMEPSSPFVFFFLSTSQRFREFVKLNFNSKTI